MCVGTCTGMCMDKCMDVCRHACRDLYLEMCLDMCVRIVANWWLPNDDSSGAVADVEMCTYVYNHVHKHCT